MKHHGYYHGIKVSELQALLAKLDGDLVLVPNQVSNLSIVNARGPVGFVDLGQHEVVIYDLPNEAGQ